MPKKPVIMVVDDEQPMLKMLHDTLERRYGADYQVVSHDKQQEALDDLERMKTNGEQVALVIADQWMPGITGVDLLRRAYKIFTNVQRALMVAWGDKTVYKNYSSCLYIRLYGKLYIKALATSGNKLISNCQ